jgi:hypothetical protein
MICKIIGIFMYYVICDILSDKINALFSINNNLFTYFIKTFCENSLMNIFTNFYRSSRKNKYFKNGLLQMIEILYLLQYTIRGTSRVHAIVFGYYSLRTQLFRPFDKNNARIIFKKLYCFVSFNSITKV